MIIKQKTIGTIPGQVSTGAAALLGSTVKMVKREGITYNIIGALSTPGNGQVSSWSYIGQLKFSVPFSPGERIYVLYIT